MLVSFLCLPPFSVIYLYLLRKSWITLLASGSIHKGWNLTILQPTQTQISHLPKPIILSPNKDTHIYHIFCHQDTSSSCPPSFPRLSYCPPRHHPLAHHPFQDSILLPTKTSSSCPPSSPRLPILLPTKTLDPLAHHPFQDSYCPPRHPLAHHPFQQDSILSPIKTLHPLAHHPFQDSQSYRPPRHFILLPTILSKTPSY